MFQYSAIPFDQVSIRDPFWNERQRVNHEESLVRQYDLCERTGRFDALKLQWKPGQPHQPHIFWDSDTAKWLEAACHACRIREDASLREKIDRVAKLFAGAQQPDGYLNSYFTGVAPAQRWKNLRLNHELYCAGHFFEAAVAHHALTGEPELLQAAERYADYIGSVFGPGEGQIKGYDGHEEIELALVKLYRATQNARYLELASFFIEQRGQSPSYFALERKGIPSDQLSLDAGNDYFQAHQPVREQKEATGHAVRAVYLYGAMADLAREKGDESLFAAAERLWKNVAESKLYVTGGIGNYWERESFSASYFLPNDRAYCETCAQVGLVFWAHRMLQHSADRSYAEVIERALYNGVLSGMSLDGKRFFYQNPLASCGDYHRQEWFECSCCPSNLSRLLGTLGGYVYSEGRDSLLVHLYIGSEAKFRLGSGVCGSIRQESEGPWSENIRFTLDLEREGETEIGFRVPSWAREFHLRVNGQPAQPTVSTDGYAHVRRTWKTGDVVEVSFAMAVLRLASHPCVVGNGGQRALQRGPFVYCIEDADFDTSVLEVSLPREQEITAHFEPDILGGVTVLRGQALATPAPSSLYFEADAASRPVPFMAIPYFAWDNRAPGAMRVWIPQG